MIAHNRRVGKLGTRAGRVGTVLLCLANCQATAEQAPVGNVPLEEPKVTEQAPVGNVPLEEPKVTLSDFLKTVDQHNWYTSFAFTIGTTILTLGLGLGGLLLFRNVRELKADLESDLADANKKVNDAIELVEKKAAEVDDLKTKLAEARTSLERDYRQKAGAGFCFITLELGVVLHKLSQADLSTPGAIPGLLKHPAERFLSWTLERASQAKGLFTYRPEDRADELPLLANLAVYEGIAHKRLGRAATALKVLEDDVLKRDEEFRRIDSSRLAKAYYNAACYACLSDEDVKTVLTYLERATALDGGYRLTARNDLDLTRVRGEPRFNQITTTP